MRLDIHAMASHQGIRGNERKNKKKLKSKIEFRKFENSKKYQYPLRKESANQRKVLNGKSICRFNRKC